MKTPILTCEATWSATSITPSPKMRLIMSTLWKARTTCPLTSRLRSWGARFRYRWDAASYSSEPGRESISANIAATAARGGWWRLCMGKKDRKRDGETEGQREGEKEAPNCASYLRLSFPLSLSPSVYFITPTFKCELSRAE